ncbi:MAG: malto-oligosyltrehalose synthase [Chitinophagaceae bacterium]|nr:malto-oligosyltrehalose synthase [Chitinophagaceae bacterium]
MSINPVSTYRIQFNKNFTFSDLEKIIPYLHSLGVKTIYASPVFEATPGSTHGYDGTDPNRINPEIGTEDQLRRISAELKKRNMYWLQDIVPNHLAFHENNQWLMDVLEKGRSSEYASYFDITWNHPEFGNKLIVPFPGSELEKILKKRFPSAEHYVLIPWQDTDKKINYRRFFLVNGLICTNIQDDHVFNHYHTLIKKLCDENIFDGLRVDHIDGLYDPEKYLRDLRKLAGESAYIIVEKILEPGESMSANWHVQGNSGYDFLGMVNNLFTYRNAEFEFTTLYYDITGDNKPVQQQIAEKKSHILHQHMQGELDNLTRLYRECGLADNMNDEETRKLIADYLVNCPVYRYYGDCVPVMERDKGKAGEGVKKFYNRCMQFTGPLMAKGVEDTLMYTCNRFVGHNEVGDSPEFFGYTIADFHEMMIHRQKHWPLSLNGSSTHDTKRGEDVRARLNAVSCFPAEWRTLVLNWMKENESLKEDGFPDKNDEYFIYQTLVGSFPSIHEKEEIEKYPGRIAEYLQKALREAKVHTNWTEPNVRYEEACINFAKKLIQENSSFRKTFEPLLEKISHYGITNSLAQLVLKFTCPGIPDVYQGTELWDLSLVDPDNRRPVDFVKRKIILRGGNSEWSNGEIKLYVLHQLLKIREQYSELLTQGDYIPLKVVGKYCDHVIAFMRKHGRSAIIVIVPVTFALIDNDQHDFTEALHGLIPENLVKRQLLHISDLFQIIHVDLVG